MVSIRSGNRKCDTIRVTAKPPLPVRTNLGGRSPPASAVPERSRDERTRDCGGSRHSFRTVLGGSQRTRCGAGGSVCRRWGKPASCQHCLLCVSGLSPANVCNEAGRPARPRRPRAGCRWRLRRLRRSPAPVPAPQVVPPSPPPPSTIPVQTPKINPHGPRGAEKRLAGDTAEGPGCAPAGGRGCQGRTGDAD